jgi:UDP-N-acetylmuramoyl-tripeptide--D-alanyl-D-alanine ligase
MSNRYISRLKNIYWLLRGRNSARAITTFLRNRAIISAAYLWRRLLFNTTFIAITGSFGKTTTKEFIADILEQKFSVVRTPGNWNHRKFKGPEMTILKTRPWHKFAIIEIGAEKPGNMESAAKFLKPDIVVITNVKRSHTASFNTLESIALEKSQLLKYMRARGCAIINLDNAHLTVNAVPPRARIIRFGQNKQADFRLLSAESRWPERLKLSIFANGVAYEVKTRLLGTHWSPTVMAALATANHCGIAISDAINTMQSIEPFWSRMQPVYLSSYGATIIREDAHGQLDSLEVSLKFLEDAQARRKILVISDFSDSNLRSPARAKVIGQMAARYADIGVFVGPIAIRSLKAAIAEGLDEENAHAFSTTALATDFLKTHLRQGDLVLIKGLLSHHLPRVYLGLIGDVKCSLEICSRQTGCDNCPELGFKWSPHLEGLMAPPGSYV